MRPKEPEPIISYFPPPHADVCPNNCFLVRYQQPGDLGKKPLTFLQIFVQINEEQGQLFDQNTAAQAVVDNIYQQMGLSIPAGDIEMQVWYGGTFEQEYQEAAKKVRADLEKMKSNDWLMGSKQFTYPVVSCSTGKPPTARQLQDWVDVCAIVTVPTNTDEQKKTVLIEPGMIAEAVNQGVLSIHP